MSHDLGAKACMVAQLGPFRRCQLASFPEETARDCQEADVVHTCGRDQSRDPILGPTQFLGNLACDGSDALRSTAGEGVFGIHE